MSKYKKMYITLFNNITDAIAILEKAQKDCETLFTNSKDANLITLKPKKVKNKKSKKTKER